MQPSELRIENLVSGIDYSSDEEIRVNLKVLAIDTTGLSEYTYMFESLNHENESEFYNDIEPIKLTEDWLLRFGFEMREFGNHRWYDLSIQLEEPQTLTVNPMYEMVHIGKYGVEGYKHVHQLQNLFHSLTGQELKLKE